jgi:hypothetical protein
LKRPIDRLPRPPADRPSGYAADGPGFHVWEESHGEAVASAAALAEALSLRQARRLSLRAHPGARPPRR